MASSQGFNNLSSKEDHVDLGKHYLDIVLCPFDSNHKLRRHRMPYHLLKCKKNFPDKIQCPHNHLFYCDKNEMAKHVETCPFNILQTNETQTRQDRACSLTHNYDLDNYKINEPYWD